MSMPPKDITPADLWTQITAEPRAHRIVDFPRKKDDGSGESIGQLAMVVLTQEEQMKVNADAAISLRKYLKDNGGQMPGQNEQDFGFKNLHEMQTCIEVLIRACRNAEDITQRFFPSKEAMKKHLSPAEVAILMRNYLRVQTELGPIISHMSTEEMDAWIDLLVTGGSEFPLDSLSLDGATGLLMHMASRLYNLQKDKSSLTTPPSDIIEIE